MNAMINPHFPNDSWFNQTTEVHNEMESKDLPKDKFNKLLNGNAILCGTYLNSTFEDAFLRTNKTVDQRKMNYINWLLSCGTNLDQHLIETRPNHFQVNIEHLLKYTNAMDLTVLIIRKKIAFYQKNQTISYEVV